LLLLLQVMGKLGAHRNIPAHNPAATQPHLAYKISAMFPEHMLAAINSGQILHAAEKQEDRQRMAEKKQVREFVMFVFTFCVTRIDRY
jgi:hypothetical protein